MRSVRIVTMTSVCPHHYALSLECGAHEEKDRADEEEDELGLMAVKVQLGAMEASQFGPRRCLGLGFANCLTRTIYPLTSFNNNKKIIDWARKKKMIQRNDAPFLFVIRKLRPIGPQMIFLNCRWGYLLRRKK